MHLLFWLTQMFCHILKYECLLEVSLTHLGCVRKAICQSRAAQLYPSFIWPSYFEYSLWKLSVGNRLWCCTSLRCIKHPIVKTLCQVMAENGHPCHLDLDKSLVLLVCYQAVVWDFWRRWIWWLLREITSQRWAAEDEHKKKTVSHTVVIRSRPLCSLFWT